MHIDPRERFKEEEEEEGGGILYTQRGQLPTVIIVESHYYGAMFHKRSTDATDSGAGIRYHYRLARSTHNWVSDKRRAKRSRENTKPLRSWPSNNSSRKETTKEGKKKI